ncbi:glycoside hydrolase family 18 protein [Bacteroides sp. UBA939]|uniref:glycoside hydrolase family 18 protein n=1 Tax=Bacteroides sp. UBA939 TaxID=1946092 RepID=UPI0025BB6339|nr:glycosyl hydrolase family 18 protein [Bacteroides sp. UBA939]
MKKILLAAIAAAVLLASCEKDDYVTGVKAPSGESQLVERVDGRIVLAYATYYGTVTPNAAFFTHLNYAFAEPYMENGEYVGLGLQGGEDRFQKIVELKKKHPGLKICISFTDTKEDPRGGCFSRLAKSDEFRKKFAADCKAFVQKWGIDGVDMDWEFPGLSWSGNTDAYDVAVDVANHVLLMKQLRETLGNGYLLTYAGYSNDKAAVTGGWRYIDIAAVNPYVDFVNIMTYDLDEAPRHQSALNDPRATSDCTRAVQAYLNAGMPANKLVLGVPFYARHSFSGSPTAINYNRLIAYTSGQGYEIDNWDEAASVPYITYNGVYYAGYDNEKSIAIKGEWLLNKGMSGIMYWDYDGDDTSGTLRKAVWNAVMKK